MTHIKDFHLYKYMPDCDSDKYILAFIQLSMLYLIYVFITGSFQN
jgi:hypothetical protein